MSMISPRREESGAVAIIVAISALMLFAVSAIVVDLGNGFTRKRDVQSQADFAALAGGSELPAGLSPNMNDPEIIAVRDYLNNNQPQDDDGDSCVTSKTCVSAGDLVDGSVDNGEVYYSSGGEQLRVLSPLAEVDFGLAGALGASGINVQAGATVQLRSPGNVLPFFLPRNCLKGPVALKNNTEGEPGNVNLAFDPASSNGGGVPDIDSATPATIPFGSSGLQLTLEGSKFSGSTLEADFFRELDNDRVPSNITASEPATYVPPASAKDKQHATVTVPDGVANRSGYWQMRLKNSSGWSKKFARIFVDVPNPEPGCGVAATGDFGFLDSPRSGVNQQADALAANIALGVDHVLDVFSSSLPPDVKDSCNGLGNPPFPGSVLDIEEERNNLPNCVSVQTGFNSGDALTPGIVLGGTAGSEEFDGLLDKDTLAGCDRDGGSSERSLMGVSLNNDVLSCFLAPGVKVGDVTGSTIDVTKKNVISSKIFDSPRFAVIPIINYPSNPQNGFYPVTKFWPVFITDESAGSQRGSSYASALNGVALNNAGNKVASLTVVPIHPDTLPESTDDAGNGTIPWLGSGTRVIVMVD